MTLRYNTDKLTKVTINGIVYNIEYDDYGNIIQMPNASITYNSRNLMDSYTTSNNRYEYFYNYQGLRCKKQDNNGNTTYYYYDGSKLIGEDRLDENNQVVDKFRYLYDESGICGICYINNNVFSYYNFIKDPLGNISKIMHKGKCIGEYIYDAWGNSTLKSYSTENSEAYNVLNNNPFRYKGYYYDVETNLALVSSRYYSPELGRFIQPADVSSLDPQSINGLNLYTYANNNPIVASYSNSDSRMSEFSVDNNLITFENSQTPINSSIFNQTIKGSFKSGLWSGNISLTGLYADWNARAQISLRKGTFKLGVAGKFSLVNNSGQIGFGTDDLNFSIKGVGDLGTISGMAGIFIDPRENYYIIGVEAEAAVLSGRIGGQLEIFGLQIEGGVSGKVLAIGGKFGIGYNDGELYYHSGFSVLFGWDIYIRIRFDKLFR